MDLFFKDNFIGTNHENGDESYAIQMVGESLHSIITEPVLSELQSIMADLISSFTSQNSEFASKC